jgi:hypothetical protein
MMSMALTTLAGETGAMLYVVAAVGLRYFPTDCSDEASLWGFVRRLPEAKYCA